MVMNTRSPVPALAMNTSSAGARMGDPVGVTVIVSVSWSSSTVTCPRAATALDSRTVSWESSARCSVDGRSARAAIAM